MASSYGLKSRFISSARARNCLSASLSETFNLRRNPPLKLNFLSILFVKLFSLAIIASVSVCIASSLGQLIEQKSNVFNKEENERKRTEVHVEEVTNKLSQQLSSHTMLHLAHLKNPQKKFPLPI